MWMRRGRGGVKNDVHNYKVLKPCSWMRRMKGLWMKRWRWSGELLRMAYIIIKSSNLCIHSCQYNQYFSVLLNHLSFMTSHLHSSHLYTYTNSDTQPLYLNTTPPPSPLHLYTYQLRDPALPKVLLVTPAVYTRLVLNYDFRYFSL